MPGSTFNPEYVAPRLAGLPPPQSVLPQQAYPHVGDSFGASDAAAYLAHPRVPALGGQPGVPMQPGGQPLHHGMPYVSPPPPPWGYPEEL